MLSGPQGLGAPGLALCSVHHIAGHRALGIEAAVILSMVTSEEGVGPRAASVTSCILTAAPWGRRCPHCVEGCRI